ncbi:CAAX geranylgeranyltransferase alpha subunit, partial [Ascosphaera acerosa]
PVALVRNWSARSPAELSSGCSGTLHLRRPTTGSYQLHTFDGQLSQQVAYVAGIALHLSSIDRARHKIQPSRPAKRRLPAFVRLTMVAGKYSDAPEWADTKPIPLDDGSRYFASAAAMGAAEGGEHTLAASASTITPLVSIAYTDEYVEATGYLRAVMAANEMSERALRLTEDVIAMNPAHYTVWWGLPVLAWVLYRAKILEALDKDAIEELAWLNKAALKHLKNYQIWHHRQTIVRRGFSGPHPPTGEQAFLMTMLAQDAKNYHVWTYRHWLVRHYQLWDDPQELRDVEALIEQDVRNNSAWSHRWTLRFGPRDKTVVPRPASADSSGGSPWSQPRRGASHAKVFDEDMVDAEIEYAKQKILIAPANRSPWVYLRAVMTETGRPLAELQQFASRFVDEVTVLPEEGGAESRDTRVKSTQAVEVLVDCLLAEAEAETGEEDEVAESRRDGEGESHAGQGESDAQQQGGVQTERPPSGPGKALPPRHAEAVRLLNVLKKYDPIRRNYYHYKITRIEGGL